MLKLRHIFGWALFFFLSLNAHAKNNAENYYRSFWNPHYHGTLLDYCTVDHQSCGLSVANQYCRLMGYKHASKEIMAHNVGMTRFISTSAQCKGWECNGFKLIQCMKQMKHSPAKAYYYRSETFVFPRYNDYRVDWCYKKGFGCGQKAAYSFCRRMGYLKATHIEKADQVFATQTIGNQELCFGKTCQAFKKITCYR